MIDILAIDRWASRNNSWLHRASAPAKLLALGTFIAMLVLSKDAASLAFLYAVLVAALLSSRLPPAPILGLSLLPVSMSALFALTRLGTTWESALVIVEKGAITSLGVLLVASSTPLTELLRVTRWAMPGILADVFFLAYRSIFILLGRGLAARDALRLRLGRASRLQRLRTTGLVGALVLLRATELATDQYAAMRLRGLTSLSGGGGVQWRLSWDAPMLAGVGLVVAAALLADPPLDPRFHMLAAGVVLVVGVIQRALKRAAGPERRP